MGAGHLGTISLCYLRVSVSLSVDVPHNHRLSIQLLSQTLYTTTLSDAVHIKITNRFLSFYGAEYLVLKQYIRRNELFLYCISEADNKIILPKPSKRVYISKDNGDKRPLLIITLEDKMVQTAPAKITGAVYEPVFLDCIYGFRPGRGCHDALRALNWVIEKKKTQRVLDADIKSCFGQIPHKKLLDCLKVKIKDPNILWLVKKYLKAGVMEDGNYSRTDCGTVQGGNISPILANVYMHYMLTLWFCQAERKTFQGEGRMVNFADDFTACFSKKEDAEKFYADLKERLADFGLKLLNVVGEKGKTAASYIATLFMPSFKAYFLYKVL